ncbi:hypothetical protein U9M48_040742 [Paspalum notatum var. saurae]|uniref:Uncharacterized protein n=1 Tax=Paspalum notatum var. saurae TaxID=547442 RepID=A0AAQ3UP35_PASNO
MALRLLADMNGWRHGRAERRRCGKQTVKLRTGGASGNHGPWHAAQSTPAMVAQWWSSAHHHLAAGAGHRLPLPAGGVMAAPRAQVEPTPAARRYGSPPRQQACMRESSKATTSTAVILCGSKNTVHLF